jgi:hypothetical protein
VARDEDLAWLLAQHLRGGPGELLVEDGVTNADAEALRTAVASHDVDLRTCTAPD